MVSEEQDEDERIRSTAMRYTEQFPWLGADPIEAYISFLHTLRVHAAAIERYLAAIGQPKPISLARHTVLRTLYFADGHRLSQNEISREVGVSRTNITNLIDALMRDDMVSKSVHPDDRRVNEIQLTQRGIEFCSTFIPAVADFMASMFADLSEPELAQFRRLLSRLRDGMYSRYLSDEALGLQTAATLVTGGDNLTGALMTDEET